ncbi:hypothetical protein EDD11_009939, partial [Mortierella claussenii]
MGDTPPGSPTASIAPFQTHYGQHQQQQQRSQVHSPPPSNRNPGLSRAYGESEYSQMQAVVLPTSVAPGADTSISSVSSTHSYSSLNSNQRHSGSIAEGAVSIISNSILTNAVNQSLADIGGAAGVVAGSTGGGMNSNNSFFTVKQSSITRGISSNLSGPSPTSPSSPQQDRVPGSANSSPSSSGAIARPPMSSQRNRDNVASKSTSLSAPATVTHAISILPSATAEMVAQEGSAQAIKLTAAVSTAISSVSQPTTTASESGTSATLTTSSVPVPHSATGRRNHQSTATAAATAVNHKHRRQQHDQSYSHESSSSGHVRHNTHVHTQVPSTRKKHRQKAEPSSRDAPRPSATVPPAPAPAMHWTRARVHGQIPPKDLRAQTVSLVGESIYIFGGCDAKTCFNTLYIFDADTMHWSQPKTYGSIPPPCRAHSSTLVDSKRLYIFGGGDGPQYFNELYMLDTDTLTWTNPQTTGARPCRRRAHTTCVYNNHIFVFGGGDGVQALNDTYQLDLATMHWKEVSTTGTTPLSRGYHTSNLIKSHFIIYGGSDGHECFSDVHVLDLDTKEWTKIDINRALPRMSHTSTQVGSFLFVVGGHDGNRYSCDVEMLNLVTWSWETRKVYGIPPAGRGYHASLLYDSRLFMFGGYDGLTVFDDIYILDLSTCAYLPQIIDFQVRMVERRETGKVYALKYISKAQVIKMEAVRNILRERQILESLDHAFVVNMRFAFQDDEYMYMCMDL